MSIEPRLDIIGAALADPSRSRILCTLMDGRAFTNKELANAAGVSAQTASAHLQHLADVGLTTALRSGRCVYHRLAGEDVARILETLATITPLDHLMRGGRISAETRLARSCYCHLAGRLGVLMTQGLRERGVIEITDAAARPGPGYNAFLSDLGIDIPKGNTPVRPCLDWTERRVHIAGSFANALMNTSLDAGWIRRCTKGRAMRITESGYAVFQMKFGIAPELLTYPDQPIDGKH